MHCDALQADYYQGKHACEIRSARPLVIQSAAKYRDITLLLAQNHITEKVYIGLRYSILEDDWEWEDRTLLSPVLRKWYPGQGVQFGIDKDCVAIYGYNFLLYQSPCDSLVEVGTYDPMYFICEA